MQSKYSSSIRFSFDLVGAVVFLANLVHVHWDDCPLNSDFLPLSISSFHFSVGRRASYLIALIFCLLHIIDDFCVFIPKCVLFLFVCYIPRFEHNSVLASIRMQCRKQTKFDVLRIVTQPHNRIHIQRHGERQLAPNHCTITDSRKLSYRFVCNLIPIP